MSSDLVVITFKKDLDLCKLFLRSVDLFADQTLFDKFWIVITDDSDIKIKSKFDWNIIRLRDLIGDRSNNGYVNQQRAKLEIAKLINSEWYWVFDSKNFFIRTATFDDLYINDRAMVKIGLPTDYWKQSWLNSLDFFGLPYTDPIHNRTPYPINTKIAKNIDIKDFELLWSSKHICEFFFYNAWALKNYDFNLYYQHDDRIFNTTIWPIDLDISVYRPSNLKTALKNLSTTNMPVWSSGLHRTTIQSMSVQQQREWADFLIELDLFDNTVQVSEWYESVRLAAQEK